ncbi:MAG TPA: hypothetical protein VKT81_09390 [Bryobacteraceae bacterium]|nr:hypothetical protein [Bryobacteraceae bacterium]
MPEDIGIKVQIISWLATPLLTILCIKIAERVAARRHRRGH